MNHQPSEINLPRARGEPVFPTHGWQRGFPVPAHGGVVVLGAGENVDAFALLEVEGVPEVYDGAVIGHEGVLSLGGTAAEVFGGLAFEGSDFVFGASGGGLDQVEEFGPAGAGVEFIDGTDRGVWVLFVARVVGCVLHEVTVAGPDFPIIEFDGRILVLEYT